MKRLGRVLLWIAVGILFLVLCLWVFLQSHQPQLRGEINLENLSDSVQVYYDGYGVPHIYAGNEADAYRSLGYVHAQDRLFQMEMMRRVGSGRLAEVFGKDMLSADKFFRTLGIPKQSKELAAMFQTYDPKIKNAVLAYIDGVNQFIKEGKTPLEYQLAGFDPEEYTVEDMYNILGYMSYSFAFSLRTDPIVQKIAEELGEEYLADIETDYVPGSAVIPVRGNSYVMDTLSGEPVPAKTVAQILDNLPVPVFQGSNSWALAPSKSKSGKVLLANDAHIKFASPAVWYEAHIEYPGTGFYGNHLAGIPFGIIGHTRGYGWGITMFENDDSDFFLETYAANDTALTVYKDNSTAPVESRVDTIKIKDAESLAYTIRNTVHGPLINEFLPGNQRKPVSMYWTYLEKENNLIPTLYKLSHAVDKNDFRSGVAKINSPGLSIMYGDTSGNIALWAAAALVKRPDSIAGKLFIDGTKEANEYKGYYSFEENPQMENPKWGFLYSANNQFDTIAGVLYPGYYAPENRALRISSMLSKLEAATLDSLQRIQLDVTSAVEARTANEMAQVLLSGNTRLDSESMEVLKILNSWKGDHSLNSIAPVIYYKWLFYILRKTMVDELGNEGFDMLLTTHLMKRTYPVLLRKEESPWWDNLKTAAKVETRENIFSEAWEKTLEDLYSQFGNDIDDWVWEEAHFVEHSHPLGKVAILSPFFDVGPFPAPGGNETVNASSFRMNSSGEYIAEVGPSMRILVDFGDAENSLSILPTGNSGNVMSPHYEDQALMFVRGEYRKQMMNKLEIIENSTELKINPKEEEN